MARSRSASPAPAGTPASVASPSTPTRTATRCTCGSPTRRTRSAARRPATPTSTSTSSSTSRAAPAPTRVHPGYGFLAENAGFAQAVIDAGLDLDRPAAGRHRRARRQGARPGTSPQKVGAPLVPGTADPVAGADEVVAVREGARPARRDQGGVRRRRARPQGRAHPRGDPRAVRLRGARGGGRVRPRRVLRRALPRPPAARRDAVPGRQPRQRRRRVDPRLLAAAPPPEARRGGAGAVPDRGSRRPSSTARPRRSCARPATSAPAPASSSSARTARSPSSRSTPGCRSSTRSPRRSPASTSCASSSASPTASRSATTTRPPRGHSIEFRINGEDAGRNFLPAPGHGHRLAAAPAARACGSTRAWSRATVVAGAFDSMLAKLIVTGATAQQALERSRRALAEFVVDGMPTVLPFHRAVVADPAFAPADAAAVHRPHPVDRDRVRQHDRARAPGDGAAPTSPRPRERSSSRSAASGSRSSLPAGLGAGGAGAAGARRAGGPEAAGGKKAGGRGVRRRAHLARCRARSSSSPSRRARRSRGRPGRGARGDEDGAAAHAHKAGTVTGLTAEVGADGHQRRGDLRDQGADPATGPTPGGGPGPAGGQRCRLIPSRTRGQSRMASSTERTVRSTAAVR